MLRTLSRSDKRGITGDVPDEVNTAALSPGTLCLPLKHEALGISETSRSITKYIAGLGNTVVCADLRSDGRMWLMAGTYFSNRYKPLGLTSRFPTSQWALSQLDLCLCVLCNTIHMCLLHVLFLWLALVLGSCNRPNGLI